jgi:hypothetical protein
MALDIGHILFIDILKMAQYPGSPFSGNIIYDIVMFFFVPSIFLILVIWTISSRLLAGAPSKLFLLMGIGLYVFVIFNGMYAMFAYLVGPYFYFLIIIYGLFFYFVGHFGVVTSPRELVEIPGGGGRGMPAHALAQSNSHIVQEAVQTLLQIKKLEKQIEHMEKQKDPEGRIGASLVTARQQLAQLEANLAGFEGAMRYNFALKAQFEIAKRKHNLS